MAFYENLGCTSDVYCLVLTFRNNFCDRRVPVCKTRTGVEKEDVTGEKQTYVTVCTYTYGYD